MAPMMFDKTPPSFDNILSRIEKFQERINGYAPETTGDLATHYNMVTIVTGKAEGLLIAMRACAWRRYLERTSA